MSRKFYPLLCFLILIAFRHSLAQRSAVIPTYIFPQKVGDTLYLPSPFIIKKITPDAVEVQAWLMPTKTKTLKRATREELLQIIAKNKPIDHIYFEGLIQVKSDSKVEITTSYIRELAIEFSDQPAIKKIAISKSDVDVINLSRGEIDTLDIYQSHINHFETYRCTINSSLEIMNNYGEDSELSFRNSKFKSNVSLEGFKNIYVGSSSFNGLTIGEQDSNNNPRSKKITLDGGSFKKKLTLRGSNDVEYRFNEILITDTLKLAVNNFSDLGLIVPDSTQKSFGNYENLYLLENSVVESDGLVDLGSFRFNLLSLSQADIFFNPKGGLTEINYLSVQEMLDKLKFFIASDTQRDLKLKFDALSWMDYQKEKYEAEAVWAKGGIGRIKLLKYGFLRSAVNYGHQGELRFVSWTSLLILFFSLAYFRLSRKEVSSYVANGKAYTREHSLARPSKLIKYFECLWFSFIVFVSPRFPSSYFSFSRKTLFWIIAEWLCGLLFVTLFIIYIASKYSFAKKIFGL